MNRALPWAAIMIETYGDGFHPTPLTNRFAMHTAELPESLIQDQALVERFAISPAMELRLALV